MGINQSQYIRDALQYVVNHNALPWQRNNANELLYKYTTLKGTIVSMVDFLRNGEACALHEVNKLCAALDDLQLQSFRKLEELHDQGMTSIPYSSLNNMLLQLASLLRYSGDTGADCVSYSPVIGNKMVMLVKSIDSTVITNNL